MVTDSKSNYTSPAGIEFTLTAGRFAGIHPASNVLDVGCGYGEGIANIAREFRCRAVAVDISQENIEIAQNQAIEKRVSHLIVFKHEDISQIDFEKEQFDLILAEGGVLSLLGRRRGLEMFHPWLVSRGWIAFSDLILISDNTPFEILSIFNHETYHYENEDSYRRLVKNAGYSIQLMCLVPPSGWDNYYAHIARRLEDEKGFFSHKDVKFAFHREIDAFYRLQGLRFVGYLVCLARKNC